MYKVLLILSTVFIWIFWLSSPLSASMKYHQSIPKCETGYNYIILPSAPNKYVCLSDNYYQQLSYKIREYKGQIDNGIDINHILAEIRENRRSVEQYSSDDQNKIMYSIILDRAKKYGGIRCNIENQKAIISVPTTDIYLNYTLTPICSYPKSRTANANIFLNLSLSWIDPTGETVLYRGTGGTFSWLTIDRQWSGKHTLTCSYRPNSCIESKTVQKEVLVNGTIIEIKHEHSIARIWNEVVLDAIRKDRVRPPIQARNLFHISAAMYDIWALLHPWNKTYLFGQNVDVRSCTIPSWSFFSWPKIDINKSISYTAYRILVERYKESPGFSGTLDEANTLMNRYGYSTRDTRADLSKWVDAVTLGNAVAKCYLDYGKTDGANEKWISNVWEQWSNANINYSPLNPPLNPNIPGNPDILDWNRWQPISLETFIDQGGNPISGWAAKFIGAEWWNVKPFSLRSDQVTLHVRDGQTYINYLDPGDRPKIMSGETSREDENAELYKWNFSLVWLWSSHLNPNDPTLIDISPTHLGNASLFPTNFSEMRNYYNLTNGGEKTLWRDINPRTWIPYAPNRVKRWDYTRVIAEFWADGPKSETPPWHWFTIFNTISDMIPEKHMEGKGKKIDDLEWDVKGYFILWWALHDAAIWAWGTKWVYDGIRPISAIRAMADHGQSSDPSLPSYDPHGFVLIPGSIELVGTGDFLEGKWGKNIGKIKMRAWKWPKYINDPETDIAWSDWILAENWWPYQRPSFVTPPFAGYISGHSTFSRAAAEVLTSLTGDEYFPWGLYEYKVRAHNYLVFEEWPSSDVVLQWATYRDAANESALSRIWWGIHPPMDDIPGRIMGEKIGKQAFEFGRKYFKE